MRRIVTVSIMLFLSLMVGIYSGRKKTENDLGKWILISGKAG
jgi:hypothetical protein